ncbi:MAG: putative rane protein [Planctomycetaceae bacterium]|nr:putative rane protein [Planctomycetaceae bacterium]
MSNLTPVMIWAATYFIHSSLLLGGVWCWFRWKEPRSHAFRETVWKLAAAGGFVTASLQLGFGIESPINSSLRTAWTAPVQSSIEESGATGSASARSLVAVGQSTGRARSTQQELPVPHRERFTFTRIQPQFDEPVRARFLVFPEDEEIPAARLIATKEEQAPAQETAEASLKSLPAVAAPQLESRLTKFATRFSQSLVVLLAAMGGAMIALSSWGLFRLLSEHSEFRQRLAGCQIVSEGMAREILNQLLQQARVRRPVTLLMSEDDLEPGACGWLRWQIVLPSRAVDDLSPQELRALLAHEMAHLVRGDQWWLLLGRLLVVCFGWQPLNRIALREWQRASEYLCDAWAIQRDVERISLARCLTTVAEWRLVGMATIAGLGSGNSSNLTHRVERLIEDGELSDPWQRFSRQHLLSAVGTLVAVGMVAYAPAATLTSPPVAAPAKHVARAAEPAPLKPAEEAQLISTDPLDRQRVAVNAQVPQQPFPFQVELIPAFTAEPTVPRNPQLVIGIELIRAIQQQVSADMSELNADLEALEAAISQLPPKAQRPLWQTQLQRFRQRVSNMQRLRDTMLGPL